MTAIMAINNCPMTPVYALVPARVVRVSHVDPARHTLHPPYMYTVVLVVPRVPIMPNSGPVTSHMGHY